MYKEIKTCANIFTMESTFSGVDFGPFKGIHMSTDHLETLGRDLARVVLAYTGIFIQPELETAPVKTKNDFENANKKNYKEDE